MIEIKGIRSVIVQYPDKKILLELSLTGLCACGSKVLFSWYFFALHANKHQENEEFT
jgi:hypothetical protein